MKKWITSKDQFWFKKWNNFILCDDNSTFLQSVYRVQSYERFGMDWELLLCIDINDDILIGSANVIINFPFFKLYVCSCGPTSRFSFEKSDEIVEFFTEFQKRAKYYNAFASQITVPLDLNIALNFNAYEGRIFTNVTSPRFSNLVSLDSEDTGNSYEWLIDTFLPKGRRDVRASYRKDLESKLANTEAELKLAYSCIEKNAQEKGYFVRSWIDMKDFIINSVSDEMAFVLTAWKDDEIQGSVLLERSKNRLSYTMGGIKRNTPDLLTGYFLQMEGMKLAKSLALKAYDISYGGPKEVQRFKSMFNPELSENYRSVYFINNKIKFYIFMRLYPLIKSVIFKLISFIKK